MLLDKLRSLFSLKGAKNGLNKVKDILKFVTSIPRFPDKSINIPQISRKTFVKKSSLVVES